MSHTAQIRSMLRDHELWVRSGGEDGRPAFFGAGNFYRQSFKGRLIERADFRQSILESANLKKCQARGANFWRANLRGAILRDADLRDCNFEKAVLDSVDLRGAQLEGSRLQGAYMYKALVEKSQLSWLATNPNFYIYQEHILVV